MLRAHPMAIAGLLALLGGASVAQAQAPPGTRPERPYRGLFAGGAGDSEQSLVANASIGGGYDDNIYMNQAGLGTQSPLRAVAGTLSTFVGSLSYSLDKDRFGLGASVNTSARYYHGQPDPLLAGYTGGVGMRAALGRRTNLTASQSVGYVPFLFTAVIPVVVPPELGMVDPPQVDFVTQSRQYLVQSSAVGLSHSFSPRVQGNLGFGYQRRETPLYGGKYYSLSGQAGVGYQLRRDLGLNVGYQRRQSEYPSSGRSYHQDNINAGVDYRKALSFSRRTTVSFSTGSAILQSRSTTSVRAIGSASLNHEVGRSWLATAGYNRNVIFVETLFEPVMADSWSGTFGGMLSRRTQFQANIGASLGRVGVDAPNSRYDTYLAGAGLSYAASRHVNLGINYFFYNYRFGDGVVLPPGVPQHVDRQGVRFYVSLWAPIMTIARRSDATR